MITVYMFWMPVSNRVSSIRIGTNLYPYCSLELFVGFRAPQTSPLHSLLPRSVLKGLLLHHSFHSTAGALGDCGSVRSVLIFTYRLKTALWPKCHYCDEYIVSGKVNAEQYRQAQWRKKNIPQVWPSRNNHRQYFYKRFYKSLWK